jgi:hypothetical protein
MNLIGRYDFVFRVLQLPPESVTNDPQLKRIAGELWVLDLADGTCGDERKNHHDQDRGDSPRKLNGGTAVHLRRLSRVIVGASSAVTHDSVEKEPADNYKDAETDQQDQNCGLLQDLSRRSYRGENILDGSNLVRALRAQRSGQSRCEQQKSSPKYKIRSR